jgi:hypothetical protein
MEEFNPPELQEGNDGTLESMCQKYLETSSVMFMFPTKRKSAMPDCPQITKEKRVKLESSIDYTQEQQLLKISEVDLISKEKSLSLLDQVYSGELKEIIVLYKDRF